MEFSSILAFLGITVLLIVTPGSDMALITRAALKQGQFGAFSAMMGINLASVIWTILAAMGFVVLMRTIPHADSFLLIVGGLFMGYIGIKDLKSGLAMKNAGAEQQKKRSAQSPMGSFFGRASS